MVRIASPEHRIDTIWRRQKNTDKIYRLMYYVLPIECADGLLLHNFITGEMILLSPDERACLELLPCCWENWMDGMIQGGFLVPSDYEDEKTVDQLREVIKHMFFSKREITSYTILPTTSCNARCFYCYQSNIKHATMSKDTANKVIEYIVSHCGGKSVQIQWFGGEPLVCVERIDQICSGLANRGIVYTSTMVSNGYLFDERLCTHAKNAWHLEKVQITLDGTESIYNHIKAYSNVQDNPFKKVMKNVGHLLKNRITVELRMNMDHHNSTDLKNLIDELADKFGQHSCFLPYISLLFDDVGFEPVHHNSEQISILENSKAELENYMQQLGLGTPKKFYPYIQAIHCMADFDGSVLINPLGGIGKCEHYVYDNLIGHINSEELDSGVIDSWKVHHHWERCHACTLYPICNILEMCQAKRECSEIVQDNMYSQYKNWLLSAYNHWKSMQQSKE